MAGLRGYWLEEELSPKDSPGGGGGASPGGGGGGGGGGVVQAEPTANVSNSFCLSLCSMGCRTPSSLPYPGSLGNSVGPGCLQGT